MIVIGVDVGKGGAIAVLSGGEVVDLQDAPIITVGKKREYSTMTMADMIRYYPAGTLMAIEHVGSRPGEGTVSAFSFGMGYGLWLGVASAYGMKIERITPQRWRKAMLEGLPKGKGSSIQRALELFPSQAKNLTRVKDHGRADALLIAEYARRTMA